MLGVLVVLAVPAAALAQGETQDRGAQTGDDSPEEGELMSTEPVGGDLPASTPQAQQRDIPRALGDQASSGGPDGRNAANTDPSSLAPYGSQLFSDRTPVDREISVNPEYAIKPGDRVAVRMWGALSFDQVLSVDQQGNIFLPEIGPIELAGVPNGELDSVVRSAVRRVYTEDVGVYTNLLGTQPIGVYVTGEGSEAAFHFGLGHMPEVGTMSHGHEVTEIMFGGLVHSGPAMLIVGLLVLVLGHALVLALGVTSAGLQAVRLEYVEFFGKFYGGGGREYEPFGYERRYTTED